MENREKELQGDKKEIRKRLELSDKAKWNSLSPQEREAAVDRYYELRSGEKLDINKILEDNRNLRVTLYVLILGLLLGILGSVFADILMRYMPNNPLINVCILSALGIFIWRLIKRIDRLSADHLGQADVLNRLLKIVESEELPKSQK